MVVPNVLDLKLLYYRGRSEYVTKLTSGFRMLRYCVTPK